MRSLRSGEDNARLDFGLGTLACAVWRGGGLLAREGVQ